MSYLFYVERRISVSKDVQNYLEKGMYGTPQIKPDEKRKYLGTYRERVVLALTMDDIAKTSYPSGCLSKFKEFPKGQVLLNANLTPQQQNKMMQLAQKAGVSFRLVETDTSTTDIGLVYALDYAVDLDDISLPSGRVLDDTQKKETPTPPQTNNKMSFLKKLFS